MLEILEILDRNSPQRPNFKKSQFYKNPNFKKSGDVGFGVDTTGQHFGTSDPEFSKNV